MVTLQRPSRWRTMAALAVALLALVTAPTTHADIVIDLPEVNVLSDGVNPTVGELEVFVTLTGAELATPPDLSSFNIDFSADSPHVTFGAASPAVTSPLFSAGTFTNFGTAARVLAAHDVFEAMPSFETAGDNRGLLKVPFSVAAGQSGTFALTFGALSQVSYANATAAPITLIGGSIIVAVPEVGAWGLLAAVTTVVIGGRFARRRQRRLAACES